MLNRRSFVSGFLLLPASGLLALQQLSGQPQGTPGAITGFSGTSFADLPSGFEPAELGRSVAEHFVPAPHARPNRIVYPEVCTWWGALEVARLTNDMDLLKKLQARFEPLFTGEAPLVPPKGEHVDYSMFGSLPLELYLVTKDRRYLDLGLAFADAQWAKPDAQGLTPETRFWVDDMWMITILQLQAYRATNDAKYLDRAAREMAAYLDRLQQPNGLFFHAPDVPFYWGRGNGWFAAGMTELLGDLPAAHPQHGRVMSGYRAMMGALVRFQGADGMWRQLIDHPESFAETSCTGMFSKALTTGVNNGWLDAQTHEPPARRAWVALAGFVDQNADVTNCCEGTNKFNSVDYYLLRKRRTGDFHGQAAFLWAANAILLGKHKRAES
jgi:unsaturated rhamnogalacturonyl hydrolase